jgi:hypothetical protein
MGSDEIPSVARDVVKDRDSSVRLVSYRSDKLDTSRTHPQMRGIEVIDLEKEPDAVARLTADNRGLAITVGLGEQHASLRARGPDHDPPLRPSLIRDRGRIVDQVETQRIDEERNGGVVLVDHKSHESKAHSLHAMPPSSAAALGSVDGVLVTGHVVLGVLAVA